MFFSCATRPTSSITGRSAAMPCCVRNARAVAALELVEIQARGNRVDGARDAVAGEHVGELARRRDDGVDGVALAPRDRASERACGSGRQQRHVVMQVLLEERVIGLERRDVQAARSLDPDPMRDERRLDVQHVDAADEGEASRERRARLHHAVFGIEREVARRLAQDTLVVLPPGRIRGRDEPGLAAVRREITAERLDRRRHAVYPREVDVRDHEHAHATGPPRKVSKLAPQVLRDSDYAVRVLGNLFMYKTLTLALQQ